MSHLPHFINQRYSSRLISTEPCLIAFPLCTNLKPPQWALPAPGLGYVSFFDTSEIHQQISGQRPSKAPHSQKRQNCCDGSRLLIMYLWDEFWSSQYPLLALKEWWKTPPVLPSINYSNSLKTLIVVLRLHSVTSLLLAWTISKGNNKWVESGEVLLKKTGSLLVMSLIQAPGRQHTSLWVRDIRDPPFFSE